MCKEMAALGLTKEGVAQQSTLTVLHLWNSPFSTFSASITIRPAITALVVAIAGMMFPAMATKVFFLFMHAAIAVDEKLLLTFNVKTTFEWDIKGKCSEVGGSSHKVH